MDSRASEIREISRSTPITGYLVIRGHAQPRRVAHHAYVAIEVSEVDLHIISDPLVDSHLRKVDRCCQFLLPVERVGIQVGYDVCGDELALRGDYEWVDVDLEKVSL